MSVVIDYRQRLLEETSDLSPTEMEKIYEVVMFLKENVWGRDMQQLAKGAAWKYDTGL